jgi:hypothetical protein
VLCCSIVSIGILLCDVIVVLPMYTAHTQCYRNSIICWRVWGIVVVVVLLVSSLPPMNKIIVSTKLFKSSRSPGTIGFWHSRQNSTTV